MTHEDAVRKAMACLRLAKSSNQAEAALAAAKAQEIIDRFKLDVDNLDYDAQAQKDDAEPIRDFGDSDPLERTDKESRIWTLSLASYVARANQCKIYYTALSRWTNSGSVPDGYSIKIVGRPSDVQTVRYVHSFLKSEVARLRDANTKGNSAAYKGQYCRGVVDAIAFKLREQKSATETAVRGEHSNNPLALVRVNNAIARIEKRASDVEKFMKDNLELGKGRGFSGPTTSEQMTARARGRIDGKDIKLGAAKAGIGLGVAGALN